MKVKLKDLKPGDCFFSGIYNFIVLEHRNGSTLCITREPYEREIGFHVYAHSFNGSFIKKFLEAEVYPTFEKHFGDNIITEEFELLSVDMNSYGTIKRNVGLLTFDEARKFSGLIKTGCIGSGKYWTYTPWALVGVETNGIMTVDYAGYFSISNPKEYHDCRPVVLLKPDTEVFVCG